MEKSSLFGDLLEFKRGDHGSCWTYCCVEEMLLLGIN